MRYSDILIENQDRTNATLSNALKKMNQGYDHGLSVENDTCYAYVGNWIRMNPDRSSGMIRFWGVKRSPTTADVGMIAHADIKLDDGSEISDFIRDGGGKSEKLRRYHLHLHQNLNSYYDLVKDMSILDFKRMHHTTDS